MLAYQVSCPPAAVTTIVSAVTLGGSGTVIIQNTHATEPLFIGGDGNQDQTGLIRKTPSPLTMATGFRLPGGKALTVDLHGNEVIYGCGAGTTVTQSVTVLHATSARIAGIG